MVLVCLALMSTQSGTGTRHRDPWQRWSQSHLAHVWDLSSRYDQLDRVNNVDNSSSSLLSLRVTLCWECFYSWRLRIQGEGRSFQKHGCFRFLLCWLVVSARFCRKTSLFSLADAFRSVDGKCFMPRCWTIVTKQEMGNGQYKFAVCFLTRALVRWSMNYVESVSVFGNDSPSHLSDYLVAFRYGHGFPQQSILFWPTETVFVGSQSVTSFYYSFVRET